ncbi:MAG: hypothetical protein COV48_14180 [Elusimicrobia bacterium CG11_big_fil_rev_8_21_14_0_20_64_6]|nr:MAG: hypothetical protein COV48_14180 [Elusimicrobia bacterium CG11_big_fil_rev_8_21_14_0_20_64_6]
MPGKKILVIDDDKAIHAALRALLTAGGHQVISALDSMQGLMMMQQTQPDLIILDINMPAGGGVSVYERLRVLRTSFSTPVLIYTAVPLAEVRAKIPDSPDVAFLSKPKSPLALKEAIERFLPLD